MTERGEPVWLPGYFTGRLHAVTDPNSGLVFHGTRLAWSVCGRAVAVALSPDPAPLCDRCVFVVGPPPMSRG